MFAIQRLDGQRNSFSDYSQKQFVRASELYDARSRSRTLIYGPWAVGSPEADQWQVDEAIADLEQPDDDRADQGGDQ